MAGTMARAVGLFMAICVLCGTGSCQSVPDGQVYTEVKKTLVLGFPGVLTCRFFRDPVAVYWEKGHGPSDLEPILVWHNGEVSGPRHDDGSCEIDENYSLIINNVSTADAGRIYCTVSNYRGILIKNYTDVSVADTAIETRSEEILQVGQGTYRVLQCTVRIKTRRVSWKKGARSPLNETLVVLENDESQAARSGFGYDEGMYNITEDYSLIIKNVHVHHEGLYVCEATDYDTEISFQGHTFVNVIAQPRKPFPTILECMKTEQNDSHYCTIDAKTEMTLTCQVMEYYPDIHLFFLHGSKVIEHFDMMEWNNTDGTKNKTVTIAARASKELYTCVASDIPGSDGRMTTSVLLQDEDTFNSVLVVVLICFAALILLSLMAYFIWRKGRRHSDTCHGSYTQARQEECQIAGTTTELKRSGNHRSSTQVRQEERQITGEYLDLVKCVYDALMKHYKKIHDLIDTKSTLHADIIISENKIALFDTDKMLADWRQSKKFTYDRYIEVLKDAISTEENSDHVWPSNDELRWISRHLNQESMTKICKELNITCKTEDENDEEKWYHSLNDWRNKVAHENVELKHKHLFSAIQSKKLRGLLPPLKGRFIYKAELVDMAFNLLMSDLLPVAEALGINAKKLVSYRPAFEPSHLNMGTIGLLSELLNFVITDTKNRNKKIEKGDERSSFCSKIEQVAYHNVATCGRVAYDMSYAELYAISDKMRSTKPKAGIRQGDTSEGATQSKGGKGAKGAASKKPRGGNKEDSNPEIPGSETPQSGLMEPMDQIKEPEITVKDTKTVGHRTGIRIDISDNLVDLQRVLQLTDEDIADGLGSSHPITAPALFKIWKEKPRPSVFNYRAALAHELRGIPIPVLADHVIAGKYIKEETSLEFIQNMVQGLSQDQLINLGKLLELSGKDEEWYTNTPFDVICQQIYDWVAIWTEKMKEKPWEWFKKLSLIPITSRKHRAFNDKLVEQGFLDLAREIMIIEQPME